jgi:hypothetical protein
LTAATEPSYEGFRYYRSPFSTPAGLLSGTHAEIKHQDWHDYRTQFEEHGNPVYLKLMLDQVTIDNPPTLGFAGLAWDDPGPIDVNRLPENQMSTRFGYLALVLAMFILGSTVAGLIGGLASSLAVITILGIVFGIAWVMH